MSSRPCNKCEFERIKREAGDKKVELKPRPLGLVFPAGVNVFVDGKLKVWFAAIPLKCEC